MIDLRIARPVVDLCRAPGSGRDRQVLLGTRIKKLAQDGDWIKVTAAPDEYPGYIKIDAVAHIADPTHRVATSATHAYLEEDFKSPDTASLPFGAQIAVLAERQKFWETDLGYISKKHLRPLDRPFSDPVTVAQLHFGVPYLWGGNSTRGLDCSGLVSASLRACNIVCPGDSGEQRDALGAVVDDGAYQRGDLVFWNGHVGMMVDDTVMIHANAHHMAVAYEPIKDATLRIAAQGDGHVIAHRRLG